MTYHVVAPADLEPTADHPCDRRSVTEAVGLSNLTLAVYKLAPGEQLARTYHFHQQREEVFHVLAGTLHVETPEAEFEVEKGSMFVAEPESPLRPYNPADTSDTVRVLGVGAPRADPGIPYDPA